MLAVAKWAPNQRAKLEQPWNKSVVGPRQSWANDCLILLENDTQPHTSATFYHGRLKMGGALGVMLNLVQSPGGWMCLSPRLHVGHVVNQNYLRWRAWHQPNSMSRSAWSNALKKTKKETASKTFQQSQKRYNYSVPPILIRFDFSPFLTLLEVVTPCYTLMQKSSRLEPWALTASKAS